MIRSEDLAKQIGNRIYELLKERNMSQKELADKSYLSEACVSKIIQGQRLPSAKSIINISRAFDLDVIDIIQYEGIVK